eukprot:g18064.t1
MLLRPSAAASYQLRSFRAVDALRMAEGSGMSDAEEKAKQLNAQAAALRESIAASEAEMRPPTPAADPVESKSTPVIRDEDMPRKPKISNDMKERLKRELISQGADPNKSAGNPILIVAAVIGLLVIVGGQGIFY